MAPGAKIDFENGSHQFKDYNRNRVATTAGTWTYHNMAFTSNTRSKSAQSLAVHKGKLWMLYIDHVGTPRYSTNTGSDWATPLPIYPKFWNNIVGEGSSGGCALAEFNDILHAIFVGSSNELIHYQYDDQASTWGKRMGTTLYSTAQPALCAFNGKLFCAYQRAGSQALAYSAWDPVNGWLVGCSVNESTWGVPALYTLKDNLYMLFAEADTARKIDNLIWVPSSGNWKRVTAPNEATAYGCGATSDTDYVYMSFQQNNGSGYILIPHWNATGSWSRIADPNQKSNDTPVVAVFNKNLYLVFNSRNDNRDVLWSTYSLPNVWYDLDTWMTDLGQSFYSKSISELTIPGTHDSCAITTLSLAATQNLYITAQLNVGIRYFDLRAKLDGDGLLYMYHGDWPLRDTAGNHIKLATVLSDMVTWLRSNGHSKEGILAQIKDEANTGSVNFALAVKDLLVSETLQPYFRTDATIPKLSDIQGKIQLIRRYTDSNVNTGIDFTKWDDDSSRFTIAMPNGKAIIQDNYKIYFSSFQNLVTEKSADVTGLMTESSTSNDATSWYINFASATAIPQYNPYDVATGMWFHDEDGRVFSSGVNKALEGFIYSQNKRPTRYGTLILDFPELPSADLIALIITCNRVA